VLFLFLFHDYQMNNYIFAVHYRTDYKLKCFTCIFATDEHIN